MSKQYIAESELALSTNKDGEICVYHLNLTPKDIADTIILVGDPDRVPKVSRHFDKIEFKTQKREFITHTGIYKNKRMTVVGTGIGTDNIDIVMNELDALANINLETREIRPTPKKLNFIRLGTSGALQKEIPLDAFVVADYGVGLDVTMNFYERKLNQTEQELETALYEHLGKEALTRIIPYIAQGSDSLVKLFEDKCIVGMTATAPGFFGAQGRTLRCPLTMPNFVDDLASFNYKDKRIANFEMETSSIYAFGKIMNHNCCAVNHIIINRHSKKFTTRLYEAMDEMIEMALGKLATL